ncbi:hypothetical protein B0H21DRAFT_828293 [Amylocystis lapponica]|nr:hypothetical protein B0H21DRAFT_828293 [Amylocystis lapponica]
MFVLIDTNGLRSAKVKDTDCSAAVFLAMCFSLPLAEPAPVLLGVLVVCMLGESLQAKVSVAHLDTRGLLWRDYKEGDAASTGGVVYTITDVRDLHGRAFVRKAKARFWTPVSVQRSAGAPAAHYTSDRVAESESRSRPGPNTSRRVQIQVIESESKSSKPGVQLVSTESKS